ncbi:hypothetical protein ACFLZG_01630 [Thermodesulfobacteriota bacterium]
MLTGLTGLELLPPATGKIDLVDQISKLFSDTKTLRASIAFWTLSQEKLNSITRGNGVRVLSASESFLCVDIQNPTNIDHLANLVRLGVKVFLNIRKLPLAVEPLKISTSPGLLHTKVLLADIALYLGTWRESLRKPILKVCFDESGKEPYTHKISFGLLKEINLSGQILRINIPGFNSRVLIYNDGKSTAKNVLSRVEKIELYQNRTLEKTLYYHPTRIKWSGEPVQVQDWNPVDIPPKSHFFYGFVSCV